MKKSIQTLMLLLTSIIICYPAISQPKIVIVNPNVDFGEVNYSEEFVATRINIKNEGKDTLIIINVKPECGCTVVETYNNIVPPGDTTSFIVNLYLDNLSGKISKFITVYSNDSFLFFSVV